MALRSFCWLAGLLPLIQLSTVAAEPVLEFPAELVKFQPFAENPVFQAGPGNAWDAAIRERGWIHKEGNTYHLWYTGYDGSSDGLRRLGYATSPDGIQWTRHPQNPLVRDLWVEDMMVLKHKGTYYMFAEGKHDQAQLLTSTDRIHWTRQGALDVRLTSGQPIPAGPYGTPTVFVKDGVWHLFYERGDQGVWLATSKDRKVWTNIQDDPVLKLGPGNYDAQMIAMNQIIEHRGRYYAYYHGSGSTEKPRLWSPAIAVSSDLIHWTKYEGNPLRDPKENRSSGMVVPEGNRFRFYTMHGQVDLFNTTK